MIYSGRGITIGVSPSGNPFVGYSLTGRSPSSQARKLVYDEKNGVIRTSVTDREQLERGNPALLLYPAIAFTGLGIVASNGTQTNLIYTEVKHSFGDPINILNDLFSKSSLVYGQKEGWIDITNYEPDAPNFTPRISAYFKDINSLAFNIVKRGKDGERLVKSHSFYLNPGQGKLITTYKGRNESPLLPFQGGPLEVKVGSETADDIVDSIYEAINHGATSEENYAVASAVMLLRGGKPEVAIRNRVEIGN